LQQALLPALRHLLLLVMAHFADLLKTPTGGQEYRYRKRKVGRRELLPHYTPK
jgi:hypothetical protein